ncbi:hypothetical protein AZE42_13692 [Rhizopogon vesiculosus]|uniref:Uncharacterized protein n=1 Tax=Rhizopogon vesiculosus TaxID=180088 RepID=A0A1J8R1Y2_9AGAM|nr:hypothetical protein AZE42_13692 [Rhizopogon vesiculosus]
MLNGSGPYIRRIQDTSLLKRTSIVILPLYALVPFDESLVYRFSSPLLSVAGQRLVLNLKSLKTRSYTSRDLSLEVDRQLEAFAEADCPIALDDVGDLESGRGASDSGNSSHD